MQTAKPPDSIVDYQNNRHHRETPNWKGKHCFHKQMGYVGALAFYLRYPPYFV